jgi:hypothetical protein
MYSSSCEFTTTIENNPLLTQVEGNFPRLRARPAHFVGNLPAASKHESMKLLLTSAEIAKQNHTSFRE